jgi:hypothetical protein
VRPASGPAIQFCNEAAQRRIVTAGSGSDLRPGERERLAAIRDAERLADLQAITGADSEHDAYVAAKEAWFDLLGRTGFRPESAGRLPGTRIEIDDHEFWVHGITHADTEAEGQFLRRCVSELRAGDATVYCEQGIRSMYFEQFRGVCEMDDYRWAMAQCADLEGNSHLDDVAGAPFEGLAEDVSTLAGRFRDAAFSLIDSGSDVYGEAFERTLGDVASEFLMSHEDLSTGQDFESFRRSREAAEDPSKLTELQSYYRRAFLPQPLEREWLRRHDPELEVITHARNERMADYAVSHNDAAEQVHLVVGAAHQPGITYYLEQHRDGERSLDDFEPMA